MVTETNAALDEVIALGSNVQRVRDELVQTIKAEEAIKVKIAAALGFSSPTDEDSGTADESNEKQRQMQVRVDGKLKIVQDSLPHLDHVMENAAKLEHNLQQVRVKADAVSRRVRQLDLARTRALKMWNMVRIKVTIKECMMAAQKAINEQDYKTAAEYVFRYHQVSGASSELTDSTRDSSSQQVKEGETIQPSENIMSAIECELRDRVLNQLNVAVETGHEDEVLSSCIVFSKLGIGREGVSRFTQFIRQSMEADATSNFNASLSAEDGAVADSFDAFPLLGQLISQAQAIMNRYREAMHKSFSNEDAEGGLALLRAVVEECDSHICQILDRFLMSRKLNARVNSSMTLSSSPSHKATNGTTPLADRIMNQNGDKTVWLNMSTLEALDDLLFQLAQTMQLVVNFDRYITYEKTLVDSPYLSNWKEPKYRRVLQELAGSFLSLTKAYMSDAFRLAESVDAPIAVLSDAVDDNPESVPTEMSSLVDDGFSIVKSVLERALATGHADASCGTLNLTIGLLQDNLLQRFRTTVSSLQAWESKTKIANATESQSTTHLDILRGTAASLVASQGLSISSLKDQQPRSIVLNSVHEICSNIKEVEKQTIQLTGEYMQDEHDKSMLLASCEDFADLYSRFDGLLGIGIDKVLSKFKSEFQARATSNFLDENFSYDISEQTYEQVQAYREQLVNDAVASYIAEALNDLIAPLVEPTGRKVLERIGSIVANVLEDLLSQSQLRCSLMGAILLEQQMRSVVDVMLDASMQFTAGNHTRQTFAKVSHMLLLLGLTRPEEAYEWQDVSHGVRMDGKQVKCILEMRTDFDEQSVLRLKL